MTSNLDLKIEDKKLQLGSLNDEIVESVNQVNHFHQEQDKLISSIGELLEKKKLLGSEIIEKQNSLASLKAHIISERSAASAEHQKNVATATAQLSELSEKFNEVSRKLDALREETKTAVELKNYSEKEQSISINNLKKLQEKEEFHEQTVRTLERSIKDLQKGLNGLQSKYESASDQYSKIVDRIKSDEKLSRELIKKIDSQRQLLIRVQDELQITSETLEEKKRTLRTFHEELNETQELIMSARKKWGKEEVKLKKEKTDFVEYKTREQDKLDQAFLSIEGIKKDYERKDKDRRIVVARLQKMWKKHFTEDFPINELHL